MRKLLSANFSRLWKSKIFWLLETGTFLFSAIIYFLVRVNVKNMGESWIFSIVAVIVGIPAGGIVVVSVIEQIGLKMACSLVIALVYTAIFTMTIMLDSNKARCAIVNILLVLLLMIVGFMIFSTLEQLELKYQMLLQKDGSYLMQENISNPRYVGGNWRTVYMVIESVMPAAFAMRLASNSFSIHHVSGCTVLIVLLTAVGVTIFRKKDIK